MINKTKLNYIYIYFLVVSSYYNHHQYVEIKE